MGAEEGAQSEKLRGIKNISMRLLTQGHNSFALKYLVDTYHLRLEAELQSQLLGTLHRVL